MEAKHWGEYESLCDNSEEEVDFDEIDAYVDHKPVTQEKLKLYLPYDELVEIMQVPEECVEMDSTVIHTVKLLQHSRALKELLSNAYALRNGTGHSMKEDSKHLPEPPLFPDGPRKASKFSLNYPFRYLEKEHSEFSEGEGIPLVTLSPTVTRQVLRKVIATLLAHVGFETTSASALEVFSDICSEYLHKITRLMRTAADREAMTGTSGFPDVMERVFHEMGIGSVCTLHSFYQSRVIMYHARMMHTCRLLDEEYQTLRRSLCHKEEANLRAKIEEEDVPEIHVPAEYGEGGMAGSLEKGYQILEGLELVSLDQLSASAKAPPPPKQDEEEEELINVSDSPGRSGVQEAASVAAADLAQSKPKKRKRKNNL